MYDTFIVAEVQAGSMYLCKKYTIPGILYNLQDALCIFQVCFHVECGYIALQGSMELYHSHPYVCASAGGVGVHAFCSTRSEGVHATIICYLQCMLFRPGYVVYARLSLWIRDYVLLTWSA